MDKIIKIAIAIGITITAFSISYYLVIFIPQKDKEEMALKKECAEWALNKATNNKTTGYQQDEYDDYFARCLREKGL